MKHCPNPDCSHRTRYGRVAELRDRLHRCPDCGEPLAPGEAPMPEPAAYLERVTVYTAANGVQAHLVRAAIEAEGIDVHVGGEALLGAVGELPAAMNQVTVQVPPEDAERARAIALACERSRPTLVEPD